MTNAHRDVCAVVSATLRGDAVAVEQLLATYNGDGPEDVTERGYFVSALVANVVHLVRFVSFTTGRTPEAFIAALTAALPEA
jgi:hypothetical protein